MSIEDDFYGTIKFKNGEEIFAKVAASEEEDRTMLIVHTPVIVSEVKAKGGLIGYKVEPWLKTSREDMFIINMENVLTLSESSDMEMSLMYKRYLKDSENDRKNNAKINRKMGYLGNVDETRITLEQLFKLDINKNSNS